MFPSISPKQSFPALESEILAYWKANNTFQKSIDSRSEDNPYRFYDGPPFITGTPHYGSLLSSIVKDAVGRYWTMRGKRVDRVWGWDCHGLPIEEKVQKKLGLSSNKEIEERGVKEFIDGCYEYTESTSAEWEWYIDKIGRWVDMDNAYRTMDQDYMESVMWVFGQLWEKGLIYEGKRVSLYSWKLSTPISNFEVAMDDTYQDVNDPAITVKFRLEKNDKFPEGTSVLAWTTTPWTIPANMALGVGENIEYVLVENNDEQFIVAKNRAEAVFKGKGDYTIVREFTGKDLVGLSYTPPFPEYYHGKTGEKTHKVYAADFATDTDGTGIVHLAPEFGDVDFGLAKKEGITITEAMDEAGKYTDQIFDYAGTHYLDANRINIDRMKENGTLFKNESITHRVPFCPRSNTPLVQKAQASWFIDIQSQKEKLLEANKKINWFPEHLKFGRFAKGIESAPDWCISRTRFWGAPMPVWMGDDGEKIVVSSREEIFELNKPYGQLEKREVDGKTQYFFTGGEFDGKELNLHRPYIDSILLAPKNTKKPKKVLGIHGFKRTEAVVDFFEGAQENLKKEGIQMDLLDFGIGLDTNYAKWSAVLDTTPKDYDTWVCHSLGCRVAKEYIIKNNIQLKKLILVAPNIGPSTESALNPFTKSLTEKHEDLGKYVDEIIVISSRDDMGNRNENARKVAELSHATFVDVTGYGHFNLHQCKLIEGLITHGAPLTRVKEVLDVWMDSGSMPYAQMHYPFENKKEMEASFPADFIAEYVGQVRAWFYVMHVLGVLLNPNKEPTATPSFTNVITTGVINGNDGRKMSKSYGNYPDPRDTIEKYGADPIRFYMLNSPLLSGGDMDFKEEGIIETIKSVMLPLWNTYSFFTTYANIDLWKSKDTEITFVRHAETPNNSSGRVNGGGADQDITAKGEEQARAKGREFKVLGQKFDVIITTSMKRTHQTAKIIAEEIGFNGIWEEVADFSEQKMGKYEGKTHAEIENEWKEKTGSSEGWETSYRNNEEEPYAEFVERISGTLAKVKQKYEGKKILIVAHGGTGRAISADMLMRDLKESMLDREKRLYNCEHFTILGTQISNPLDRWILSRLQVLIGQVHDAMDGYDVSRACRAIVEYMDELTNWYVRLSRRRFWESGMTRDKESAYETLYTVLVEVSKLLAPFMPFLSESIFQGLTKKESVHLEYITLPNRHLIDANLNRDMQICEQIVSLGLALRSSKNIRVRQPLSSITITRELDEYYQNIIRDELNVKGVRFENPENLAKKICKPDARKIGPRFGKDVQYIITEAKNGNFIEKDDGSIQVGDFTLERGEYTIEYLPLENVGDVMGGYGMVVALDTLIDEDLKHEGYARDIIRLIQDMRKDANYNVTDRITLSLSGENISPIVEKFGHLITLETLSEFGSIHSPDREKTESLDENVSISISVKR